MTAGDLAAVPHMIKFAGNGDGEKSFFYLFLMNIDFFIADHI
jgi:hypothetical protein